MGLQHMRKGANGKKGKKPYSAKFSLWKLNDTSLPMPF